MLLTKRFYATYLLVQNFDGVLLRPDTGFRRELQWRSFSLQESIDNRSL
jgi:hypothetical protein